MGNGPRSVPAKLLALLDAYSHENTAHSLSELARRTGLPMATAHRLIGELARWGGPGEAVWPRCRSWSR